MRLVFAGLLPGDVLARSTKAYTTTTVFGPWSRAFIASWDGAGVSPGVVNASALRTAWDRPQPHVATMLLLQQAWLASKTDERAHHEERSGH